MPLDITAGSQYIAYYAYTSKGTHPPDCHLRHGHGLSCRNAQRTRVLCNRIRPAYLSPNEHFPRGTRRQCSGRFRCLPTRSPSRSGHRWQCSFARQSRSGDDPEQQDPLPITPGSFTGVFSSEQTSHSGNWDTRKNYHHCNNGASTKPSRSRTLFPRRRIAAQFPTLLPTG